VLTTETEPETMNMVSGRKADLTLRSLIVAAYTIRKEGLFNLKIAGQVPEYANKLRVGVVRSEPLLRDILDKGVRTITPQEREQIINRHVTINVQMGTDYALLFKLLGALLAVAGIGLFWTLRLRRLNAELKRLSETDQLTGLYNRARLDSEYRVEFERAQRYARPLSLIMLDIDHFKRVNDELGHLSGDKVLVTVASIALLSIRNTDVLGRWGGEEFLVLCPEAGTADALVVAERIRAAVEGGSFPNGRRVSISAGVGTLVPGDTTDSLLQRADAAMYAAKNSGRNRVCS
jgi:diguanylate cyclase (GGDEF)-like protein